MKILLLLLFFSLIYFRGYSQEKTSTAVSATIIGEKNMVRMGKDMLKNDSTLIDINQLHFCYNLVVDYIPLINANKAISSEECCSTAYRRKCIVLNYN